MDLSETVKIAVWRPLKLGDFLVATPALRALRTAFPHAQIDYIGLPEYQGLAERYPHYLSGFVPFPGLPGLPEREWVADDVIAFLQQMHRERYDLLLQLQGNGTIVNPFVALCGAKESAGFTTSGAYRPNAHNYIDYPEEDHAILKPLRLLAHLGIAEQDHDMDFPIHSEDYERVRNIAESFGLTGKYICIHTGALSSRPWKPQYFAQVADECIHHGFQVVLTGSMHEKDITANVQKHMLYNALDFTGLTDLGMLGALLQNATFYIGNDTGVSHIAVAVGTPSVTIFTSSDPKIWRPLDTHKHAVVIGNNTTPQLVIEQMKQVLHYVRVPQKPPSKEHTVHE